MSFREKSAWLMAIILVVAGANYIWQITALSALAGQVVPPIPPLTIVYIVLIVIAAIIGHTIIALLAPSEANAPMDERERQIGHRAGNWAGLILGVGAIAGLWHYSVNGDGNFLFHLIVCSLLAAQIAEYLGQIWMYRRGYT